MWLNNQLDNISKIKATVDLKGTAINLSTKCYGEQMKALIAYVSVEHGNTEKVARAMAEVLGADIKKAEDVDPNSLSDYDLIGFGSGIFKGKFHPSLLKLIDSLPQLKAKSFIISTGGYGDDKQHPRLKEKLESKGMKVLGGFSCKAWDTYGPFKLMGGINKGRPNEDDLRKAREYAKELLRA